jgi:hypothetical protein
MDEKYLLSLWNEKRSQIISAQIAPTLMLIAVFVIASFDIFATASDAAKYLTLGVAAVTGILAIISQYAAIREAQALVLDLQKLDNPSSLAIKVSQSGSLLNLTAFAIVAMGLATFGLVAWAVVGEI